MGETERAVGGEVEATGGVIDPDGHSALMTAQEVAGLFRCNVDTIRKLARVGSIPALRVGRQWRFVRERVLAA